MKNMYIKFIVLFVIMFSLVGCSKNNVSQGAGNTHASNQNESSKSKVVIKGYYDRPVSMGDKNTVIFSGLSEGEFVEILVQGEIRDFEHVRLEWDENKKDLIEKEIINRIDKAANQAIVIKTYMPEGIPSEKIKWKSMSGKDYEYIIQECGMDDKSNDEGVFYLD